MSAGIGQDIARVLPGVPVGALALLCMAAYLAGVVQAPITSFVIVSEMTENHAMIVPIMLACLIANVCSTVICADGVYQALVLRFIGTGDEPRGAGDAGGLATKDSV